MAPRRELACPKCNGSQQKVSKHAIYCTSCWGLKEKKTRFVSSKQARPVNWQAQVVAIEITQHPMRSHRPDSQPGLEAQRVGGWKAKSKPEGQRSRGGEGQEGRIGDLAGTVWAKTRGQEPRTLPGLD